MKSKTYFYHDELNDDFANTNINTKTTPKDYIYLPKNIFYKIGAFIIYYIFAKPLTYLFIKIAYHQKYVNKKVIRKAKHQGCFFYGNHTLLAGDAFIPNHFRLSKNYIVVGPDSISIPGIRVIVKMLGAIPLPFTLEGTRNYLKSIKELINKKKIVTIYPEAHIWPKYTKIRNFKSGSFAYPVDLNAPCFSFTNTYKKSKSPFRKYKVVTYIEGPFYPNIKIIDKKLRIEDLRNRIYDSMVKNATLHNEVEINKYIYKEN